jgi:hypothetical protein
MAELAPLLAHGILSTYTHFEATEVFATLDGQKQAINVFTILVAEDRQGQQSQQAKYLTDRIQFKSLPGWTFGVQRYTRPISELPPAIDEMVKTGEWRASGKSLQIGNVQPIPHQFVPPDSTTSVPWNRLLKNNFWNGSHVFEWANRDKKSLRPLFDDSRSLQDLSEIVFKEPGACE